MERKHLVAGFVVLLVGLTACRKDPIDNLKSGEGLLYITNRDSSANFASYNTFSIADSVAVIDNNKMSGREKTPLDSKLINAVISNMQQRGYTQLPVGGKADLAITVSRIYNNYNQVVNYGDYWGYYDGYWDPYYWGYPGYSYYYPSFYGVYNITDGAVEIDMFDLKNAETNNDQIKYVWNGMIRGSGTFNENRADSSVSALFHQSAYIGK